MKGAVFIALGDMVVEEGGWKLWHQMLDDTADPGVFTSTSTYDDSRLVRLLVAYQRRNGKELEDVLRHFGEYLFGCLHKGHPVFAESQPDFFAFIQSIGKVIHLEVSKLDPEARPPRIEVDCVSESKARVQYYSERRLCYLAEGLLHGAARQFGVSIEIRHAACMHDGADCCELWVNKHG